MILIFHLRLEEKYQIERGLEEKYQIERESAPQSRRRRRSKLLPFILVDCIRIDVEHTGKDNTPI